MPRPWFAASVALLPLLLAPLAHARQHSESPCRLAVVSRQLGGKHPVCDDATVRHLAEQGQAFEQNQLGLASLMSLVIGPDFHPTEALRWFQRAAQKGYAPAQVNLGVLYTNGWATPVNYAAALRWFREAASQHFAPAYFNLGILYMKGLGVRQDYAEARRWFQQGADAGDTQAETNLGYLYDQGLGLPRNPATAARLYRQAADAGNALGQNNLADLYLRGEGLPRDYAQALTLFRQAAAQGSTGACIKLGYMYANGLGVTRDPETAYAWITSAAAVGDPRGNDLLAALESALTPQQREHARARTHTAPFERTHPPLAASFVE